MKRSKPETHRPTGITFSAELTGLTSPGHAAGSASQHVGVAYHRGAARYQVHLQGSVNAPLTYPQSTDGTPRGSEWNSTLDVEPCLRLRDAPTSPWDVRPTGEPLPGGAQGPTVTTRAWVVGEYDRGNLVPYSRSDPDPPAVELEDVLG